MDIATSDDAICLLYNLDMISDDALNAAVDAVHGDRLHTFLLHRSGIGCH